MKLQDFLEYLWTRPATSELAQSLATVFVERGRFDLVPVRVSTSAPRRVAS